MERRRSHEISVARREFCLDLLHTIHRLQGNIARHAAAGNTQPSRSEEHTSELQSLMRISYAVFCLKKKKKKQINRPHPLYITRRTTHTHTLSEKIEQQFVTQTK